MPLDLRPLSSQSATGNRGGQADIGPDQRDFAQLFKFESGDPHCVRGELLGLVLGVYHPNEKKSHKRKCVPPEPLPPPSPNTPLAIVTPRGHLTWNLGNACFYATFDFVHGGQFGFVAEQAQLCVEYHILRCDPKHCPNHLPILQVCAGVGYGGCCRPLTLTELACAAPDKPDLIRIPNFARAFTVVPLDGASPDVFDVSVVGPHGSPRVPVDDLTQPFLFPGSAFVEVASEVDARALVVFEIAL
jgi:hypothetical protein